MASPRLATGGFFISLVSTGPLGPPRPPPERLPLPPLLSRPPGPPGRLPPPLPSLLSGRPWLLRRPADCSPAGSCTVCLERLCILVFAGGLFTVLVSSVFFLSFLSGLITHYLSLKYTFIAKSNSSIVRRNAQLFRATAPLCGQAPQASNTLSPALRPSCPCASGAPWCQGSL